MTMIPTDEELAAGVAFLPSADDMEPTTVPGSADDMPKKKRGRQPYPRDEFGNIIRPDGTIGTKPRDGSSTVRVDKSLAAMEARAAARKLKTERYVKMIREEVNPMLLDVSCMITSIPKTQVVIQRGDKYVLNPMGDAMVFNDIQTQVFAMTGARLQETPAGQAIAERFNQMSPYLFLGLSGVMLLMFVMNLMALRQLQVQNLKAAMQGVQEAVNTGAVQNQQQQGQSLGDMISGLFANMNRKDSSPDSEVLAG